MKYYKIFYLIIALFLLISSCTSTKEKWIEYKSEKSGFKVEFPKTPIEKLQSIEVDGQLLDITMIMADCQNDINSYNKVLSATYSEYPKSFFDGYTNENYETFFQGTINGMVNSQLTNDGNLLESKVIDFHGYQAREVKIQFNKKLAIITARFIVKENAIYILYVSGEAKYESNPDIQKFFDSFEFLNDSSLKKSNKNISVEQDIKNWNDGKTTVFNSSGNPKAKNLLVRIKYLNSWEAQDGDRPNVIKKFLKQNGKYLIGNIVLIRKFDDNPTDDDIDNYLNEYCSSYPSNSIFSTNKQIIVDGESAVLFEIKSYRSAEQSIQNTPIVSYFYDFHIFYNDYIIQILYSVKGPEDNVELQKLYTDYKDFFKLSAASFVIESKWPTNINTY